MMAYKEQEKNMRITDFELLCAIKAEYRKLREEGQSRNMAMQVLLEQYHNELTIGAEDDGLLFWIGLADAQYAVKELSQEVAAKGIVSLELLAATVPELAKGDIERRKTQYACAPMPERKSIRKPKRFRCQWKIGDTFAYRLSGPDAEKYGFMGDRVLLRKVDEIETWDKRLLPIVTVTHWPYAQLPFGEEEFQQIPVLKLSSGRLSSPENMYEYRVVIQFTSEKQVTQLNLHHVGNFPNTPIPADEFYYRKDGYILMMLPKEFDWQLSYFCSLKTYFDK